MLKTDYTLFKFLLKAFPTLTCCWRLSKLSWCSCWWLSTLTCRRLSTPFLTCWRLSTPSLGLFAEDCLPSLGLVVEECLNSLCVLAEDCLHLWLAEDYVPSLRLLAEDCLPSIGLLVDECLNSLGVLVEDCLHPLTFAEDCLHPLGSSTACTAIPWHNNCNACWITSANKYVYLHISSEYTKLRSLIQYSSLSYHTAKLSFT